jgi:hypothetical protein
VWYRDALEKAHILRTEAGRKVASIRKIDRSVRFGMLFAEEWNYRLWVGLPGQPLDMLTHSLGADSQTAAELAVFELLEHYGYTGCEPLKDQLWHTLRQQAAAAGQSWEALLAEDVDNG